MSLGRKLVLAAFLLLALANILYPILSPLFVNGSKGPQAAITLGLVDVQKVFESSDTGKQQNAAYKQKYDERLRELKSLNDDVQAMQLELQQLANRGNEALVQSKLPRFQAAKAKLEAAQKQANQELLTTQTQVDKAFMTQLKAVLDKVRQEEELDMIQAYDPQKQLSFDASLDVTQKVLVKYNQMYPPGSANASPKTNP